MAKKKILKDYESAMQRLEEISDQLETTDTGLEDSISLYTEGLEIACFCDDKLNDAEKKIKIIVEKSGKLSEVPFDTDEVGD